MRIDGWHIELSCTVVLEILVYHARDGALDTELGWAGKINRNTSYMVKIKKNRSGSLDNAE